MHLVMEYDVLHGRERIEMMQVILTEMRCAMDEVVEGTLDGVAATTVAKIEGGSLLRRYV